MNIVDAIFTAISFLSLIGTLLIFAYLFDSERGAPSFSHEVAKDSFSKYPSPKVSVIVTAKNEEEMIASCVTSLLDQTYSNTEIIVIDDSSTDRTVEIVGKIAIKNQNVKIFEAGPKPTDWVGKSWPCWIGYQKSTGEYLLFVDADSVFDPSIIERSVHYVVENSIDMFSLSPRVSMHGLWANAVLPLISGAINLLYPMRKVNDSNSKRAYVFGTYFFVKKDIYEKTGGHSQVKNELVEDAAVARLVKSAGYRLRIEKGSGLLSTEWESDLGAIFRGLERITSASIRSFGMISVLNAVLLFFLIVYPVLFILATIISNSASGLLLAGLLSSVLSMILLLTLTGMEMVTISGRVGPQVFLYLVGGLIFIIAIVTATLKVTRGKELYWKGQGYRQDVISHIEN